MACNEASLGSLWQDNSESEVLDQLVVHDVVYKPHLQQELAARVVEILVRWQVVACVVSSLPASKEREPVCVCVCVCACVYTCLC